MVKTPSVDDNGMRKGAWTKEEDEKLKAYVQRYGHWNWQLLPKFAGLARSGKSCRLRWMNYLKPGLKRGNFSPYEHDQIINLHAKLGNKWSAIALELPGRTDNEVKNYWYGHIAKRNPAGKSTCNEEQVIKPTGSENLLLESYEVPSSQATSSSTQNEEMVSAEASKLETDHSNPHYSLSAEPIKPDFWTRPFELDTDTPQEMDIYSQASQFASFLEEDLMFNNAYYNDFSFSDYASN